MGQQHLQAWINTGLFALAIMAAFICDLLRRRNLQLRELAVELTVRNQETERREQMLLALTVAASAQAAEVQIANPANALPAVTIPVPETEINTENNVATENPAAKHAPKQSARPARHKNRRDRTQALSPDAAASIERGLQMATDPRLAAKIKKLVTKPQVWQDTEGMPISDLVTELFERHAAKSEAAHARKPASARVAKPAGVEEKQIASVERETVMVSSPSLMVNAVAQTAVHSIVQSAQALEANKASKKNWSALLSRQTTGTAMNNELLDAVVAATAGPAAVENPVPAGFYDGHMLSQIVRSNQPVSGLIVSIGVSGGVAGGFTREISGEARSGVADLMRSLLGPTDFGCQSGEEEFLLIYTGERGASAQRRLSSIAQQLWHFQLRALGRFEILFSWGGMEVRSESVETAIASAKDRMIETKRGRKLAIVSPVSRANAA